MKPINVVSSQHGEVIIKKPERELKLLITTLKNWFFRVIPTAERPETGPFSP